MPVKNPKSLRRSGFTLVELAIVLVIIALVIAGVFVGADMVNNARRNQVISDLSNFRTSYEQFTNKYDGPPGDLADAEAYWGGTVNGNGDWHIVLSEEYRAWQHLGLAGMLKRQFSGQNSNGGTKTPVIGVDIPAAPQRNAGYRMVLSKDSGATSIPGLIHTTINLVSLGAVGDAVADGEKLKRGVMHQLDAYSIDAKIDDGLPYQGLVLGNSPSVPYGTTPGCVAISGLAYETAASGGTAASCSLIYLMEALP